MDQAACVNRPSMTIPFSDLIDTRSEALVLHFGTLLHKDY